MGKDRRKAMGKALTTVRVSLLEGVAGLLISTRDAGDELDVQLISPDGSKSEPVTVSFKGEELRPSLPDEFSKLALRCGVRPDDVRRLEDVTLFWVDFFWSCSLGGPKWIAASQER